MDLFTHQVNDAQFHPSQRMHLFHWFRKHIELIAALLAGILILIAWTFNQTLVPSVSISLYLSAFLIGGFAKAKEGITETISNKALNVEMLMIFAAIGSASIGYWTEGAILIFIFALSGALETYTMERSERELQSLMKLQPETALKISNGVNESVHVSQLEIGDHIVVKAGDRIPIDGTVLIGNTSIDESAISGEAFPVPKQSSDHVYAGTVNINGSITVKVLKHSSNSLFQKIIHLVNEAQTERSKSQLFLEKFEVVYVKVILISVLLLMFLPTILFDWSFSQSIYRAMILLVVASPCALVASIMPATLSAISNGARNGILFKGGVHVENLSHVHAIAFDKTGTLTNGKPIVTDAYFRNHVGETAILEVAAAVEAHSSHPLAQAVIQFCESKQIIPKQQVTSVKELSGKGIIARINDQDWRIGNADLVGRKQAELFANGVAQKLAGQAKSLVFIADRNGIAGLIALKDTVRNDSIKAIHTLKKLGIRTVMLTGDNQFTARAIASETGVDEYVAACMPEDKVTYINQLREKYQHVAMIGDGINDAPALASANIGIAMGAGTDAALETADIVLVKNKLSKVAKAITLSNRMNNITKQNITFSLAVILLLIITNFFQLLDLPLGVIGHEGSTILVILNGLRLLK